MPTLFSADVETFRDEVRTVIEEELPADWRGLGAIGHDAEARAFLEKWRETMARRRLLGITWPTEYGGRGLSKVHQVALVEELARVGLPFGGPNDTFGLKMLANTLLLWGTEAQKSYHLPRILSGEDRWCQGYSEPGSGSDLASVRTRATVDGDDWLINGQKIWTSQAHLANWIFMLVRTDPDASKHRGISFLLVPLDQPGIEIRPIRTLTGLGEFNEVFFTDARTPAANVVGEVNNGWEVATSLLGYERGEEAATNPILFRAEFDRLVALARDSGTAGDPVIRDRLARSYCEVEMMRFMGNRILERFARGEQPGSDASISKLYWSEYHRAVTDLAMDILGMQGGVLAGRWPLRPYRADDPGAPNTTGSWAGAFFNARAGTIYAGSSEIQRTIIAETVLGLPRS